MPAAQQLLKARTQVLATGTQPGGRWLIHAQDHAVLSEALREVDRLYGMRVEVRDDPELLGAGPNLRMPDE